MKKIRVGLIGFGTVGSGVVKVLQERRPLLSALAGVDIELARVCDKDLSSDRGVKVEKGVFTKDPNSIVRGPDIDIVVELIGGIHPAKELILAALRNKKHVVTANKALLAAEGRHIFETAALANREVRFEASVGGGIPIVKSLREGFVSNRISAIYGIINGTSNYILSRMTDDGCDFELALKAAQRMGVAEANPKLDVSGADSAHKLCLLAGLSFGVLPRLDQIYCEGILDIEQRDITYAREMGYAIKLLAIAKRGGDEIELRVNPTLVSDTHLLANVKGVYNAIFVKGDLIGEALFYGAGAGKYPAASAVVADIVDLAKIAAKSETFKRTHFDFVSASSLKIKKIGDIISRYYMRFSALDKPGVLATISGILGKSQISIASVTQKEQRKEKVVPIVMMTHQAHESMLRSALRSIDRLPVIKKRTVAIRVESL